MNPISKYPIELHCKDILAKLPYIEFWALHGINKDDNYCTYQQAFTSLEKAIKVAEEGYETGQYIKIGIYNIFILKEDE